MSARIAAGEPWLGCPTRQAAVLHILAEGDDFAGLRYQAWEAHNGRSITGVHLLPEVLDVRNKPAWMEVAEAARDLAVGLIILDTQARIVGGLNVNVAAEMAEYFALMTALKRATGACVLSVHHTNPDGTRASGSRAQDGVQDSAILLTPQERPLTVQVESIKQKNLADSAPLLVQLREIQLGWRPGWNRSVSSLVVDGLVPEATHLDGSLASSSAMPALILDILRDCGRTQGLSASVVLKLAKHHSCFDERSFYASFNQMLENGLIVKNGSNFLAALGGEDGP